ncbi:fimbrial chaperone protein [Enterobacter cloacae]|uniref:fimbria/pilus periplasmic chaperone n=1 Tax=Enterobacter cloacae TaxID=550 RepID=UPI000E46EA52|nr:fimbria/pilus periplasmic chaperone [Enterobacter cloacae]RHH96552.1 fimbrial chaperone protein [Enterobacter cloacae]
MKTLNFKKYLLASVVLAGTLASPFASADGITLGGTRIIYPAGAKQASISVRNTSANAAYLVQSWAENANGQKSADFIVTPPLYVSNGGDENMLRVMYSGPALPTDRETLYYFNSRAVPSMDKSKVENKSVLMLATTTRIKLFVRPAGLTPAADKAPDMLKFSKSGSQLRIDNPSPYYLTLVKMSMNGRKVEDVMVAPKSQASVALPAGGGNSLSFSTMTDYGSPTDTKKVSLN